MATPDRMANICFHVSCVTTFGLPFYIAGVSFPKSLALHFAVATVWLVATVVFKWNTSDLMFLALILSVLSAALFAGLERAEVSVQKMKMDAPAGAAAPTPP